MEILFELNRNKFPSRGCPFNEINYDFSNRIILDLCPEFVLVIDLEIVRWKKGWQI